MKVVFPFFLLITLLVSCHESVEKRGVREAEEYTRRYCPTPVINYSRTDSVVFEPKKRNFVYYCTFVDAFDDEQRVKRHKGEITQGLYDEIASRTSIKYYVDAGCSFTYIVRSEKNPSLVLYEDTIRIEKRGEK